MRAKEGCYGTAVKEWADTSDDMWKEGQDLWRRGWTWSWEMGARIENSAGGQLERSGLAVWWRWPKAFLLSVNEWISEPSTQWGLTVDDALSLSSSSCKYALWFHHTGVYTAAKLKSCFCISDLMVYSLAPKGHVANMRILVFVCFFTFFNLVLLSIGFKKYITINYWYLQMTRTLSCSWVGDVGLPLSDCSRCSICGNLSELYWLIPDWQVHWSDTKKEGPRDRGQNHASQIDPQHFKLKQVKLACSEFLCCAHVCLCMCC